MITSTDSMIKPKFLFEGIENPFELSKKIREIDLSLDRKLPEKPGGKIGGIQELPYSFSLLASLCALADSPLHKAKNKLGDYVRITIIPAIKECFSTINKMNPNYNLLDKQTDILLKSILNTAFTKIQTIPMDDKNFKYIEKFEIKDENAEKLSKIFYQSKIVTCSNSRTGTFSALDFGQDVCKNSINCLGIDNFEKEGFELNNGNTIRLTKLQSKNLVIKHQEYISKSEFITLYPDHFQIKYSFINAYEKIVDLCFDNKSINEYRKSCGRETKTKTTTLTLYVKKIKKLESLKNKHIFEFTNQKKCTYLWKFNGLLDKFRKTLDK